MDQLVEISIPRAHTRKKSGLFSSLYTVYELKVVLDDSYEYILFKRYKEFRNLHDSIKENLTKDYDLPKFPGKSLNSMNPSLISKRKMQLEYWVQEILSVKEAESFLRSFLNIQNDMLLQVHESQKMNSDEFLISDFVKNMSTNSQHKITLIDNFEKKYFSIRRNLKEEYLHMLIECLIPLCGDDIIGSKALYVLEKLLSSDHNRDFNSAVKELKNFPPKVLKKMRLDEYLLKKKFSDFQMQALQILKILDGQFDLKSFNSILNNSCEAIEIFNQYSSSEYINKANPDQVSTSTDWQSLNTVGMASEVQILFRFINRQLQIQSMFVLESDFSSIVSLLINPTERKKWDLRLVEIEEIPTVADEIGLKLIYSQDRNIFEFHNSVFIQNSLFSTNVNFKSKNFNGTCKGLLGKMNSSYRLEYLDRKEPSFTGKIKEENVKRTSSTGDLMMEEIDKLQASIKLTWKATFCENSKKLFCDDLFEENDVLKQSIDRFIGIAESRMPTSVEKNAANAILEACERKKLRRKCSQKKQENLESDVNKFE